MCFLRESEQERQLVRRMDEDVLNGKSEWLMRERKRKREEKHFKLLRPRMNQATNGLAHPLRLVGIGIG